MRIKIGKRAVLTIHSPFGLMRYGPDGGFIVPRHLRKAILLAGNRAIKNLTHISLEDRASVQLKRLVISLDHISRVGPARKHRPRYSLTDLLHAEGRWPGGRR